MLRVSVFLLALALAPPCRAVEFYVAPNGDDASGGTKRRPFSTLKRARDAVRELRAREGGLPDGGVTVWLDEGAYLLTESFELTEEDSGTEDSPIVYRGVPDGKARLVGGPVIPPESFRPVADPAIRERLPKDAVDQVVVADLRDLGVTDFSAAWPAKFRGYAGWPELFFDGEPMVLARWPNNGLAKIAGVVEQGSRPRFGEKPDRPGTFTYEGDRPERWLTADDVYLSGYWAYKWYDETIRVDAIDPLARTITLAAPCMYGLGGFAGEYFALGLLEELDEPGEYYFDRKTGLVYLWPPAALAGRDIAISLLTAPLVTMAGTSHVMFRDLVFEFSRGMAATITGGTGNQLAGCTVRNIAADSVRIEGGTNNGVRSCEFYGLGGGGISLSGGDRAELTPCGNYAENNHIHHYARLFRAHHDAVRLEGVGCRVSHNLIHDAPHHAIDFVGNDHLIEYNEIHHVCMETDDAGAIYTGRDWTVRGTVIRHNFFHHIGGSSAVGNQAIYLDDTACGTIVTGNVVANAHCAFLIGGGRDNVVENNIVVNCPVTVHIDSRGLRGEWLEGQEVHRTLRDKLAGVPYREEPWRTRYPELANILEDEPGLPKRNRIARNILIGGAMDIAKKALEHGIFESNWETGEAPAFVDAGHFDFGLADDAAGYEMVPGFEPIPFDEIGLRVDEYRTFVPAHVPWIAPGNEAFLESLAVSLGCRTPGAIIRYTTDGSEPTLRSKLYARPFTVNDTTTIRAAAYVPGGEPESRSPTTSASFVRYALDDEGGLPLSALQPIEVSVYGGLLCDVNCEGAMLSLAGTQFATGLTTAPLATQDGGHAHVVYDLSAGLATARRFTAFVGIDDSAGNAGSCQFAVEVRRNGEWERVFESKILRGGDAPAKVDVAISGADRLRLVVTDAADNHYSDHAAWGGAALR